MKPKMKTREICQYIPCGQTEACDSDCYIKRLEADNAALREKLAAAVQDIPHKCFTCPEANFIEDGETCLNWEYRGEQEGAEG